MRLFTLDEHISKAESAVRKHFAAGQYNPPPTWVGETKDGGIVPVIGWNPESADDMCDMIESARAAFKLVGAVQYVSILRGYSVERGELRPCISIGAFDKLGNGKSAILYILKDDATGKCSLSPIKVFDEPLAGPGAELLKDAA